MHCILRFVVLLCAACAVFCFRAPVSGRGGSYNLPNIGNYPAPQPTFPRNQGLPDAYKHTRHFRSVDDQVYPVDDQQFVEEHAFEGRLDEVYRQTRSANGYPKEEEALVDDQAELARERRSPYKIIQPTYRPPRRQKPKPIYV